MDLRRGLYCKKSYISGGHKTLEVQLIIVSPLGLTKNGPAKESFLKASSIVMRFQKLTGLIILIFLVELNCVDGWDTFEFACFYCLQIYIGGDFDGVKILADEPAAPLDSNWVLTPGAVLEEVCDASFEALHFIGR